MFKKKKKTNIKMSLRDTPVVRPSLGLHCKLTGLSLLLSGYMSQSLPTFSTTKEKKEKEKEKTNIKMAEWPYR